MEPIILFGILLALALNFVNGLNDASHSIATVVATKALSPLKATLLTGICNMLGPFIFTTAVAYTIGTAIIAPSSLTPLSLVVAMLVSIVLVFVATRSGSRSPAAMHWWEQSLVPALVLQDYPQWFFHPYNPLTL